MLNWILVVDFGSQVTQLIARRIREQNIYCDVIPYNKLTIKLLNGTSNKTAQQIHDEEGVSSTEIHTNTVVLRDIRQQIHVEEVPFNGSSRNA